MDDDFDSDLEVTDSEPDLMDLPPSAGIAPVKVDYPVIGDYFNLETPTDAQKEKFAMIWDYFSEESKSIGDLMYKMRTLESRLGSPAIGESRLQKMYNYIKISRDIKDKQMQRNVLLR